MFYVFWVGAQVPSNIHEGKVTDSSIEILWNRADGNFHSYEITCINCAAAFMVRYKGLSEEFSFYAEASITAFSHQNVMKLISNLFFLFVCLCLIVVHFLNDHLANSYFGLIGPEGFSRSSNVL